jgi:molybdopterin molybdotransferase
VTRRLPDDCFQDGRDRLSHEAAIALIAERLRPVAEPEEVELGQAHGRVVAADMPAPRDVPQFTNSAVDGYALAHASLGAAAGPYAVTARAAAGHPATTPVGPGEAARIFTGAAMPEGTDTVVMQEDVTLDSGRIRIAGTVRPGANVRQAGEDLRAGEVAVRAGTRLRPQDIAAIASTGADRVPCYRRLKVGVLSTGDELVEPGQPLALGQVFDSNRHLLAGLLAAQGVTMVALGTAGDAAAAVEARLRQAAATCDVILTTGGVSRGETDLVVATIRRLGSLHAWQIAVKPGRPLAMGQIGDAVIFGLPGNPVAVFVTFLLYAVPMLARLQGAAVREPRRYPVRAGFDFTGRKQGRREFWRGRIVDGPDGPRLMKFERDGSGLISGLVEAEGLIDIPESTGDVRAGDLLGFIPFGEFGL